MINKQELKEIYQRNLVTEQFIIDNKLEGDFCITINQVANTLGFSVENVQTYVLPHLKKVVATTYIKEYMNNFRLKIVVSKESLVSYINKSIAIEEVKKVIAFNRGLEGDMRLLEGVYDIIKDKRMLLTFFDYVSRSLNLSNQKTPEQLKKDKIRFDKVNNGEVDVFDFMLTGSTDPKVVKAYYGKMEELKIKEARTTYDMYSEDMYSIREIKDLIGFKHTQQVYRFLDRAASIKLRLNDMVVSTTKKGDRNIRYIMSHDDIEVAKADAYRLVLTDAAYGEIKSIADMHYIDIKQYVATMLEEHALEYVKITKKDDK